MGGIQKTGKDSAKFIDRTGEIHISNEGCRFKIIECKRHDDCTIQFEDGNVLYKRQYADIIRGRVKNPFFKSVLGIGYLGNRRTLNKDKCYRSWYNILQRATSKERLIKYPSYRGVTVCEEWCCFENFGEWFDINYDAEIMLDWHVDKDILFKGNKIYSPETCCFVPNEINILLTNRKSCRGNYPIGVTKYRQKFIASLNGKHICVENTPEEAFQAYKIAKEIHIKEIADKWKGQITEKVYEALYNYQVEITD